MHKTPQSPEHLSLQKRRPIFINTQKRHLPFLYAHKKWSIWKIPGFYNSHIGEVQPSELLTLEIYFLESV